MSRILSSGLVILAAWIAATASAVAQSPKELLFGADFPIEAPDQIKALLYESGMNCVRLTRGGYSWAASKHKGFADELQAHGVNVYLQLGSHYPSADYFPLKDAWFVDHAGQTGFEDRNAWSITYTDQHWPQYSYAHEGFRRQLEGDFATYLKNFASNTNVAGVILHNEPGYFWLTDRVFDYGAPAIAKFRAYLQQQHGDIATLNQRWGTTFTSFAEITPPGKPPVQNIAAWMDWRRFHAAQIADFLTREAAFFKQQRPDTPRTTNLAGPLDHWFGYRCAQNDIQSAMMDAAGIDIYPTQWTDRVFVPYSMDMTQGIAQGREAHVLETDVFSAKLWGSHSEEQRADLLRSELWSLLGHGARTVLVWGFARNDDFSLTEGDANPRYLAAREIAHTIKMLRLSGFSRPRPQVALCVDPDSYIYATGTEDKPHALSPQEDAEAHGLYAALADSHIPADVILTPQLRAGAWRNYRAIVLASARMMDQETAAQLKQFVASDGVLIVDGPFAEMDRWGKRFTTIPGAGLDRLFDGKAKSQGQAILLRNRAGIQYMNGLPEGLPELFAKAVVRVLQPPRIQITPDAARQADTAILKDSRGNLLLVTTTQGSKGQLAPVLKDVQLNIQLGQSAPTLQAFLFTSTQIQNGRITSGPRPLPVQSDKFDIISLPIGDITSAAPILLATDAPPLLSLTAPARLTPPQSPDITITVYNPSPRQLTGTLALTLAGTPITLPPETSRPTLAPHSQKTITLKPTNLPVLPTGRAVLSATLTTNGTTTPAIPLDLQIE